MSIFDENTSDQDTQVTIDQFVGEGKKYATVEEFVKGFVNANQFIEQLKTEKSGIMTDLERLQLQLEAQRREPAAHTPEPQKPAAAVEPEEIDLDARIREALSGAEKERTTKQNVEEVTQKLIDTFGDETKANEIVKQKARDLGVSLEFLQDAAAKSPKGFYALIGLTASPTTQASAAHNDVNTAAFARRSQDDSNTPGTKAFYDKIRLEDPKRYWSAPVQNAIFKARQAGTYQI